MVDISNGRCYNIDDLSKDIEILIVYPDDLFSFYYSYEM